MPETIDIPTTVFCKSRYDEPIQAHFQLGETIAIRSGDRSVDIEYEAVFDVRIGPPPKVAAKFFTGTVLIVGFDDGDEREALIVDAKESTLETVTGLLYRRLLNDVEVAVSHPAKIGGRVTEKSFEIGTLLVTPGRFGCTGIGRSFSIDLEMVVDFSRTTETLLGERRSIIDIDYVKKGVTVSLKLSLSSDRKQHLLGRFLRREYENVKEQLRGIELPTAAVHALVKLYTLRGTARPESLLETADDSIGRIVGGLERAGLLEVADDEVALTPNGWILVTESVGKTAV